MPLLQVTQQQLDKARQASKALAIQQERTRAAAQSEVSALLDRLQQVQHERQKAVRNLQASPQMSCPASLLGCAELLTLCFACHACASAVSNPLKLHRGSTKSITRSSCKCTHWWHSAVSSVQPCPA